MLIISLGLLAIIIYLVHRFSIENQSWDTAAINGFVTASGGEALAKRCCCCGRYVQVGWHYCPACGAVNPYFRRLRDHSQM